MWSLWLACFLLAPSLSAQNTPVFHADAALVTVPVPVTDAHGTLVSDLRQDEFRLYDNGMPVAIRHM